MNPEDNEGMNLDDFDLNIETTKSTSGQTKEETVVSTGKEIIPPTNREEEKLFIQDILKLLLKNWDRINAALTNLKNSKIFDITGDPSENRNIIANIQRDFEQDIYDQIEKLEYKHKEISSHPKSLSFYTLNYTKLQKEVLKGILNDKGKMDQILSWEMQLGFTNFVSKFGKMISELLNLMNMKTTQGHIKALNSAQQQMFEDAKQVSVMCIQDIDIIRRNVEEWKENSNSF
ncbi:MAG: hypothetical protein H7A24_01735 [Leptospiraceae bacterium]|nr:hypothetical protein [Leptospiraceae bacterium]MCP5510574.1 hypothetical protein [Leptospiraceae bacterium]